MADKNGTSSLSVLGVLLAVGLMAAAFILGVQFKNFRQPGTITVKGLAEKNFQSDSATWRTGVSLHGNTYQVVLDSLEEEREKLVRYDGSLSVTVNTKKLDKIQTAEQAIRNLRAKNDFIEFSEPQYLLGNLETIKRDLITQATEDAQKRAVEFAKTGGGKVGAMRSASQGSFNIYSDNGPGEDEDYGGTYDKSTIGKQVRLVVTIEYAIE